VTIAGQTFTLNQTSGGATDRGDFNGDAKTDLIWQSEATGQVAVNYYGGSQGATMTGWAWLNSGINAGWHVVAAADFDGNGVPDLVWQNDATRQITVNYYSGNSITGWNWLNSGINTGWRVIAAADFDGNGVPDLVWQNDSTRQVVVNYYSGAQGNVLSGWNWLNSAISTGWHVAAVADFDGNSVPDLVWQNDTTRQVTVNYYSGTQGATLTGFNWLNAGTNSAWSVVGANDFDGNGVPDLAWQNDATRQVTVNYYGGTGGATVTGWNWLNSTTNTGWRVVIPR
jgi:hypothetical protein